LLVFTDFSILLVVFLNTNTAITRQLIGTARTLESEWWQVNGEAWIRGTNEDESTTGRVWAAGCHHVTSRSRSARVFETYKPFISLIFQIFFRVAVSHGYAGRLHLDYFPESLLSNSGMVPYTGIRSLRPTSMPLPYHRVLIIRS